MFFLKEDLGAEDLFGIAPLYPTERPVQPSHLLLLNFKCRVRAICRRETDVLNVTAAAICFQRPSR